MCQSPPAELHCPFLITHSEKVPASVTIRVPFSVTIIGIAIDWRSINCQKLDTFHFKRILLTSREDLLSTSGVLFSLNGGQELFKT